MIVPVCVREEVAAKRRQLGSCGVQTSMESLEVIRQSPKTSLKNRNKRFDPFWSNWKLNSVSGFDFDVEFRVLVEVVEELLVVGELHVPLARLRVPKVVAERRQENRRAKEARLLAVLVQQEQSSEAAHRQLGSLTRLPASDSAPPSLTSPGHSAP